MCEEGLATHASICLHNPQKWCEKTLKFCDLERHSAQIVSTGTLSGSALRPISLQTVTGRINKILVTDKNPLALISRGIISSDPEGASGKCFSVEFLDVVKYMFSCFFFWVFFWLDLDPLSC